MDVYARQSSEHQLLRNLVDQRHTQTFIQAHQHLGNSTEENQFLVKKIIVKLNKATGAPFNSTPNKTSLSHWDMTFLQGPNNQLRVG